MSDFPYYILDEHRNVIRTTRDGYFAWEQRNGGPNRARRVVEWTSRDGTVWVSTVFLMLDHSLELYAEDHKPVVFETMVFGGPFDGEMARYCTWDEAVRGHAAMVERVSEAAH